MKAKAKIFRNTVVIYYDHDRKTLRLATGIGKVPPGDGYFKKGQLTAKVLGYEGKNEIINIMLAKVNEVIADYYFENKEMPSVDFVRSVLLKGTQDNKIQGRRFEGFEAYYHLMIEEKKSEAIVPSSLKDYTSTLNSLKLYQHLNGELSPEQMNSAEFLRKFEAFLSESYDDTRLKKFRTKGGLNVNTCKKRISTVRTFLKWCQGKEIISQRFEVENYKTRLKKYQPTVVIITKEEKAQLLNLDLEGEDEKLRDILVFLYLTGLRYSDLLLLHKGYVRNGYVVKDAQKTTKKFKVPLTKKATEILEKYDYNMNMFSTTMFNRLIKELLKRYNICCYPIRIQKTVYNKVSQITVEKYSQISSHTGRRSFIAHCIMTGHSIPEIMAMTGHSRITSLQCYIDQFQVQQNEIEKIQLLD